MILSTISQSNSSAGASEAVRQLASAELRAGNRQEAERLLREHLARSPRDFLVLTMLGQLLFEQGLAREALLHLRLASAAAPADGSIRLSLARVLDGQGEFEAALAQVDAIAGPDRVQPAVRMFEAALLGRLGDRDREIAIYQDLVSARPDQPELWTNLGNALNYSGRTKEAQAALRRAVELCPAFGEGWWSLANAKTARFDGADLAVMRKALKGRIGPGDALHLHFALGKALEDRGRYDQSFRHYDAGNRIRAGGLNPQQMRATGFVDRSIATYSGELLGRLSGLGEAAADPIFVVGLQRSGSTLVEQILASHPMIEGTAELLAMQQLWADLERAAANQGRSVWDHVAQADADGLKALGADYLERARPFRRTGRPYFVDKLPANWMMVGLIRLALPNARIIDARRHPMACGFSNFKQHYATGVAFAYSQESIGTFYRDYLRLMAHFDQVEPGSIHHVLNERLIDDPEGQIRRLLEFVGVPFDPACLQSHRTKRAVNTPSAEQVRRPINRDGTDYWRHYEAWLGPMREALGESLDQWDRVPV